MKELEERYLGLVEELINQSKLLRIDEEIQNANLFFGKAKSLKKSHLNSDYVRILNRFDVDQLTEEEIQKMKELKTVAEGNLFVKETINQLTHKNYTLDPINIIIPSHTLVLEITVGPNTKELKGEEFLENQKKQEKFLKDLKKKYVRELTSQFKYPVIMYLNKDI